MHGRPSATADHSLINPHQHAARTVKDCYTVVAGLGANEERVLVLARRALRPADEDRWGSRSRHLGSAGKLRQHWSRGG